MVVMARLAKKIVDARPGRRRRVNVGRAPKSAGHTPRPHGAATGIIGVDQQATGSAADVVGTAFLPVDGDRFFSLGHLGALFLRHPVGREQPFPGDGIGRRIMGHQEFLFVAAGNGLGQMAFRFFRFGFPGFHRRQTPAPVMRDAGKKGQGQNYE